MHALLILEGLFQWCAAQSGCMTAAAIYCRFSFMWIPSDAGVTIAAGKFVVDRLLEYILIHISGHALLTMTSITIILGERGGTH
jgi:hypothetical protein